MALVPDVQADQHRGDLLNDAGVLQLSTVQSANSGNFSRQFTDTLARVFVVAAYDHVAINRCFLLKKIGGQIVKRGHHDHPIGYKFRGLLRSRALPDAESTRGFATDARGERDSGIYENLSGTQRRFDVL